MSRSDAGLILGLGIAISVLIVLGALVGPDIWHRLKHGRWRKK